jgi:hypothetical protein
MDTTRVKRSVMDPARKPRHYNSREKDGNGSQSLAATFTGTGDGAVNLVVTMDGVRVVDNDNSVKKETASAPVAVASRKKKFKPTTKSAPTPSECNNQDTPFVISPPATLVERQSTLRLSRDASMALTFTPSLTDCHQKGRFLTKRPLDVAMTVVCEDFCETARRSSVMDRFRAIVPQWPSLAVQMNKAIARTSDGRIIFPTLLPPLATA